MSGLVVYPNTQIEVEAFVETLPSALAATANAGATTITVFDPSRWTAGGGDVLKIGDGDPQDSDSELVTTASVSGKVVTLTAALAWAHGFRTPVYKLSAATIAAAIQRLDGTETALTLSSVSTGRYRGTYTTSAADSGPNLIEVNATGTAIGAATAPVTVLADLV